jgi:hypothetical protein
VETQFSDVSEAVSALPGISGFVFRFPAAAGTIGSGTNNPITVSVPSIVNLTALAPVITHSGTAISPPSGVAQDFSSPITYTVTAQDGTTKNYTVTVTPADATLNGALAWLQSNAEDGGQYTIAINADETLNPHTLGYSMKVVGITLKGRTSERTVTLGNSGSLFTIGAQVTLTLDERLTLKGTGNNASLVTVQPGGRLIMEQGSKISGNNASGVNGAGVYISGNSGVTMNGGEISGNTVSSSYSYSIYSYGGGVYVADGGTFTVNAGTIMGNSSSVSSVRAIAIGGGGGVYVGDGLFTMTNGEIWNNTASSGGGGIYINSGTATISDSTIGESIFGSSSSSSLYIADGSVTLSRGRISGSSYVYLQGGAFVLDGTTVNGNTSYGVYQTGGTFTMNSGAISGHTNSGVYQTGGTFNLEGGTISNNTGSNGAGIYSTATLNLTGGEISSNTATNSGGGVYVSSSSANLTLKNQNNRQLDIFLVR